MDKLNQKGSRIAELIEKGREQGYLTYSDVNDHLPDDISDPDQVDEIIGMINDLGLQVHETAPDADTLMLAESENSDDIALEQAAEALAAVENETGRTTDPVRMYMREMGTVDLLTREGEIEIAKRIEEGMRDLLDASVYYPKTVEYVLIYWQLVKDGEKKINDLEKEIFKESHQEFNIGSPKQLGDILFKTLGLSDGKRNKSGGFQTSADILEHLSVNGHAIATLVLEWRKLSKLKSTYADSLRSHVNPITGRIHTSYNLAGTSTGRLSSTEPNLQNIPIKTAEGRKIREAFIAEKGNVLISADYSQIELRIMAHLSGDKNLTHAFNNNIDVHSATASEIFNISLEEVTPEHRRSAKAINFGLIYGMSAFGLTRQLGIPRHEAQAYLDTYFERYTGVRKYMDTTKELAKKNLFVETILGRKLHVAAINDSNGLRRQAAERAAINAPLQGSAADIIKKAMIDVDQWIGKNNSDIKMIMQVHDELIFEVKKGFADEALKNIISLMEGSVKLDIPLIVDAKTGANWNEAH